MGIWRTIYRRSTSAPEQAEAAPVAKELAAMSNHALSDIS